MNNTQRLCRQCVTVKRTIVGQVCHREIAELAPDVEVDRVDIVDVCWLSEEKLL